MFRDLLLLAKARKWALPLAPCSPPARAPERWRSAALDLARAALLLRGAGWEGVEDSGMAFLQKAQAAGGTSELGPKVTARIGKENYKLQSAGLQPSPREAAFSISFSKQQDETLTPLQTEFEWNLL